MMPPVMYSIDDLFKALKTKFENEEQLVNQLKTFNNELLDKHYKDKELSNMKSELTQARDDLTRGFPISLEEQISINTWVKEHDKRMHVRGVKRGGALGGRFSYYFVPTSMGVFGTIQCDVCMNKYQSELNDYKSLKHKEFDKKQKELKIKYDPSFDFQEP